MFPRPDAESKDEAGETGPVANSKCLLASAYSDSDILVFSYNPGQDISLWWFSLTNEQWKQFPLADSGLDWKAASSLPYDSCPIAVQVTNGRVYLLLPVPEASPSLWEIAINIDSPQTLDIVVKPLNMHISSKEYVL